MGQKLTLLGASLLCVLLTGEAAAVEPYLPRSQSIFKRIDANSDGKIMQPELKTLVMRRFKRLDDNGDSNVSGDELQKMMLKAVERRRARILALMDTDANGTITESELDKVLDSMFNAADSDRDGALTIAETQSFKRGPWRKNMTGTSAN
jgi:Ca2+-binding EF-hand superfamily protein